MVEFKNKTLLITGGGTGIGEAIAYQFAKKGTNIILTGLGEDSLKKVRENCMKLGVKAWYKELNLEDSSSIDSLVEYIREEKFNIDFFVLNAGISQRAMTLETDITIDRKLMEINYFGGVYLIKSLKDMLLASKDVHIAVTTSISGLFGFPLRSAYCASKHALLGFYESLALEYPHIKVTFLIPGRIRTEISKSAILASGEKFGKMDPGQANGMDVTKCAKVAIKAIAKEKHQKLIGGKELLMAYFYKYTPWLFWILARKVSAH
ncbi:MAG: SDR family NAD(P)-dependent oxidoreductase [Bacteroidales bacterium]|nr:SDR family NAD(P)-dependent oxidoreductase [Bacteroidales bacterium]